MQIIDECSTWMIADSRQMVMLNASEVYPFVNECDLWMRLMTMQNGQRFSKSLAPVMNCSMRNVNQLNLGLPIATLQTWILLVILLLLRVADSRSWAIVDNVSGEWWGAVLVIDARMDFDSMLLVIAGR